MNLSRDCAPAAHSPEAFSQSHAPRHPAGAAIRTTRQLLQSIAEALLWLDKQPAFFERGVLFVPPKRDDPEAEPSACSASRPPRRPCRDQVAREPGCADSLRSPDNDRHLLTAGSQPGRKPLLRLSPMHPKALKTTVHLIKFQTHTPPAQSSSPPCTPGSSWGCAAIPTAWLKSPLESKT
jgi:hypothetical protein